MSLLKLLAHLWFMPLMLSFAAAPVLGDGSPAGDSGGEGGGGDVSGDGTASVSDTTESTSDDTRTQDVADPNATTDPNSLVDSGDGRKIPQKYAELFKTDKSLKELFFSGQALKREFPGGVREAVEFKKSVEEMGGLDGIQQLKSDLDTHNQDAQLFESDPAKWAEQGFTENREAALKAFAHTLEYVAQNHPEQYDYLGSRIVLGTLDQGPVHDIYGLLSGLKDNPAAQELAKKLAGFYNGIKNTASKVPDRKIDPQQKKLDDERAELSKEKEQIRNSKVNALAVPHLNKTIDSNVDGWAKTAGFDIAAIRKDQPNRYARFMSDVKAAIHKQVRGDDAWLGRYSAALNGGDVDKAARMLNTRHDQAVNGTATQPGVVKGLAEEWFGAGKKPAATSTDKTQRVVNPGNGSALRVQKMPAPAEINYGDSRTRIIDQVAVLKSTGKVVTWAS